MTLGYGATRLNLLRKLADPRRFERPAFAFGGQPPSYVLVCDLLRTDPKMLI